MLTDPLAFLILFGMLFKLSGFFLRDELWLRGLVALGMGFDLTYYALQPVPLMASVTANGLLIALNLVLIFVILRERTRLGMSAEDKALASLFPTLSPGQFRSILARASRYTVSADTRLIDEGARIDTLFLIRAPRFRVVKEGQSYDAPGPAFAGEIGFLFGARASAAVWALAGSEVLAFDAARLRRQMDRRPALENALTALFARDLAAKVAAGAPLPDRATPARADNPLDRPGAMS